MNHIKNLSPKLTLTTHPHFESTMKHTTRIITVFFAVLWHMTAHAQEAQEICAVVDLSVSELDGADIQYLLSEQGLSESHDSRFITDSWCHPSRRLVFNRYWSDFGFYKRWWDDGFGYHDPCNPKLPLARTMNAIRMIQVADHYGARLDNNPNRSYYRWMSNGALGTNKIKRLRAKCKSTAWPAALAGTWFATRTIYLYLKGFYYGGRLSMDRASTLVHERGHLVGKTHNGDRNSARCNGFRCDKNWEHQGPYFYQLSFLIDVYTQQPVKHFGCYWTENSPPDPSDRCQYLSELQITKLDQRAKFILNNRFEEEPSFEYPIRTRAWVLCEDATNCPDLGT